MPTYTVYETYHEVRSVMVDAEDEYDAIEKAQAIDRDHWDEDPNPWHEYAAEKEDG